MEKGFRIKIGKREKEIFKAIGLGALILSCIVLPNLPLALRPILKSCGKGYFQKTFKKFKKAGIIYFNGEEIKLTQKGLLLKKRIQLQEITINKPLQWDGVWRLVSYDIPEKNKNGRNYFRQMIGGLGFKNVQKSLWVYPFECKEEIAIIADSLDLAPYVIFMSTDRMPHQERWEKSFDLLD